MIRPEWVSNPEPLVAVARLPIAPPCQLCYMFKAIRGKFGLRERGLSSRCKILYKQLLRWFVPYGKFMRKLPICTILGVKPTILKWQRWHFASESRSETLPVAPPGQATFIKPQEWNLASGSGNFFPDVKFCIKKQLLRWFALIANLCRTILGIKPTILKWQRWYSAWGSRFGTLSQCQIL